MAEKILSLQYVKGVGPRRAEALAREGIVTPEDVLLRVPRAYVDRTAAPSIAALLERHRAPDLWTGDASRIAHVTSEVSIVATLSDVRQRTVGKGRTMLSATISDGSGASCSLIFWNHVAYYMKTLRVGSTYLVSGVPDYDPRWQQLSMHHPEIEEVEADDMERYRTGAILAKYPMTQNLRNAGITMRLLRSIVEHVVPAALEDVSDPLPESIRAAHDLMEKREALRELHQPSSLARVDRARRRMKFEELFVFELLMAARHRSRKAPESGLRFAAKSPTARALVDGLPFALTNAQRRVINEIMRDMTSGSAMNRLLQGDVGSGKTIVAVLCMASAVDNGFQALLMAPTEILAEQHAHAIERVLEGTGLRVALVTGSKAKRQRAAVLNAIADGEVHIVVGTHALFEADVRYRNLGLIVIDEQHRFGVAQRAELRRLGRSSHADGPRTPHILVMSATPIPRTLSMTIYGDLDVSVIDELPKDRKPIVTRIVYESQMPSVFQTIRSEIAAGRQAYIVYPLVEKSEKVEAKSAVDHFEMLSSTVFPDLRVGLLHGQMSWDEKEAAMQAFLRKEFDILVATTVIEVGIDVPNATVMLIENAERFGLSQLHQLRGRVGRGADQSMCFLVAKDHVRYQVAKASSPDERMRSIVRLKTMEETTDGFRIAEVDLRLRGPGDVLGVRQSGLPEFRFADIVTDAPLIVATREAAFRLLEADPHLRAPDHRVLKEALLAAFDGSAFQTVA
jgi:ATP-dependent DNA helicase RecG